MGLTLFIIGLALGFACLGYFSYLLSKFTKEHIIGESSIKIEGEHKKKFLGLVVAQGIFVIISSIGFILWRQYNLGPLEWTILILGSYLFGLSFDVLIGGFVLYYYRTDLNEKQRKVCRMATFLAIPVLLIAIILTTEGFARYIDYSYGLPNGLSFKKGLIYPESYDVGFAVRFYGILIVTGALVSYFVCDHYFFKKYKKHGLLDTCFVFALIMGIIGARLWYCLVLEPEEFLANPGNIIRIFDGGLAIQGGAILGIIAGVSFLLIFRKYVDIRFAMDVAVPSILLAQVIGRWGNFFNHEVYGAAVSANSLWWLPTIIKNNMFIDGEYRLPLFIIEGLINLTGYFFIRYFLGNVCKFKFGLGYQASFYLIWYGMVRAILEPLREGFTLKVGTSEAFGYMQSWIVAFAMMGAGLLLWLIFFIIHKIRMNKNLEDKYAQKI